MTAADTSLSSVEPLDDHGSAVRFETQCVVIPDLEHRSRRPRVVTKSYALPLWKKRSLSASFTPSTPPDDAVSAQEHQSHLVLRVPLPTFSRKHDLADRSIDRTPLPPCLVHRAPSSSPELPARYARTPRKTSLSPSRSDVVTVPLRPCCAACQPVTEAAVVGGDAWTEHFTRAASRRRSMSADNSLRTLTVAGSAASASYGNLGVSISVDEIDKRRRSSDTGPSTFREETLSDDVEARGEYKIPLILRRTATSSSPPADTRPPPSPTCLAPTTPRIPEEEDDENENELFPLPSPKRTPTPSPGASPAGSLASLAVGQTHQSSTPSTCSGDSAGPPPSKRDFLAPPPCSSSSSLSLHKLSESTSDLTHADNPLRASSPSLLSTLPTLSARHRSRSPSPRISFVPSTPTDILPSTTDRNLTKLPESTLVPVGISSSSIVSRSSASPHRSPTRARFPWRPRRSVSADMSPTPPSAPWLSSPSISPTLTTSSNTKKSFSMSSPRHIIADVLRGVGAMGISGVSPAM